MTFWIINYFELKESLYFSKRFTKKLILNYILEIFVPTYQRTEKLNGKIKQ
jgi:hypothetical protein